MKTKIFLLLFLFGTLLFVTSCDIFEDVEAPGSSKSYLVSYDQYKSYLPDFIEAAMDLFSNEYPELELVKNKVDNGVIIYKITYNTTFNGESKLASGLVCVPSGTGTYPILSYQNGTNTLHSNAPSVNPDNELYLLLEFMASTGFIVSIPDYLGFGVADDMFHPYLHKESTVQSVTDMLRAVKELIEELTIETNNEVYLSGYSQGGWATMQVQKAIESQFSSEFILKASACGAGPYNLNTINSYVTAREEYPMPYFLGYIFNSYLNLGLSTSISAVFNEPYDSRIPTLYDGTKTGEEINAQLTTSMPELFTGTYYIASKTDPQFSPIIDMLSENSVTAYATSTPTLILHGTDDTFVPPIVSENIYSGFMAKGLPDDRVQYLPLQGHSHTSGIVPSGLTSMLWFLDIKDGGTGIVL